MFAAAIRHSVSLLRGSTRLHFAKTAERIKILLAMNTQGPWDIVLNGDLDLQNEGEGNWRIFCLLWTHYISQDWLNFVCILRAGALNEIMGSGEAVVRVSDLESKGAGFDAGRCQKVKVCL